MTAELAQNIVAQGMVTVLVINLTLIAVMMIYRFVISVIK